MFLFPFESPMTRILNGFRGLMHWNKKHFIFLLCCQQKMFQIPFNLNISLY